MNDASYQDEFIQHASKLSEHLLEIVKRLHNNYFRVFSSGSFLSKIKNRFTIEMYIKEGWRDYLTYVQSYQPPQAQCGDSIDKIELLFSKFEIFYGRIIFNNYIIAYLHTQSNKVLLSPIMTQEDKKIILFKNLGTGVKTVEDFRKAFGHYATNAYELSEKRYEEYQPKELLKLAGFAINVPVLDKTPLDDYIKLKSREILPILIAIRELAKYKALFIIRDLRHTILAVAKQRGIQYPFRMTYKKFCESINTEF